MLLVPPTASPDARFLDGRTQKCGVHWHWVRPSQKTACLTRTGVQGDVWGQNERFVTLLCHCHLYLAPHPLVARLDHDGSSIDATRWIYIRLLFFILVARGDTNPFFNEFLCSECYIRSNKHNHVTIKLMISTWFSKCKALCKWILILRNVAVSQFSKKILQNVLSNKWCR